MLTFKRTLELDKVAAVSFLRLNLGAYCLILGFDPHVIMINWQ